MSQATVNAADIRAAMDRLWSQPWEPCTHIVRPPPRGTVWRYATLDDDECVVLGCAALCGAFLSMVAEAEPLADIPLPATDTAP